jgi:hypothetical protein
MEFVVPAAQTFEVFHLCTREQVDTIFGITPESTCHMAGAVAWEALSYAQGRSLMRAEDESSAPDWYMDVNRVTTSVGWKTYVAMSVMLERHGRHNTIYILCHRIFHGMGIPSWVSHPYTQIVVFCTGGARKSTGHVRVDTCPDDDYNVFIQRLLATPEVMALWPLTDRQLHASFVGYHRPDDFRIYVVPVDASAPLYWQIAYMLDQSADLDDCMARLRWGGRGQRLRIEQVVPQHTRIVVVNMSQDMREWRFHTGYTAWKKAVQCYPVGGSPVTQADFRRSVKTLSAFQLSLSHRVLNGRVKVPLGVSPSATSLRAALATRVATTAQCEQLVHQRDDCIM